jgi:lipopolysaccharide transport system permease protein
MHTSGHIAHSFEPLIIEAGHIERHYWKDLWRYRELLYFLAMRDITVRYKQAWLGLSWAVLRPLITMIVFTIVFGHLAGLKSDGSPYALMVLVAMLPWQLCAGILADAGNSVVNNAGMISKVYFPRLIIPLSTVVVGMVDFLISAMLLCVLMASYGSLPTMRVFTLPIFLFIGLVTSIGAGLWVAALNVKYRDFRFIVAFAIQLGLYISPVGFNSSLVPDQWRLLYSLNPMVTIIDGFRWALLPSAVAPYWPGLLVSSGMALLLLISAIIYFRRTEKSFVDDI